MFITKENIRAFSKIDWELMEEEETWPFVARRMLDKEVINWNLI
jgi:hypothetical protein